MKLRPVNEWMLYRLRFVFAYGLLAILVATLTFINLDSVPPGVSPSEQTSAITANQLKFTELPSNIVDIPYHILQKLSIEWLGLSPLGLRLPSLVFGILTALLVALLLRRWFKTNVAVAAGFIVLTSAWFLSMTRLGSPVIMIPFWTSLLLLTATYISQQTKAWRWWRVVFALGAAVSLYTPAMAYLFLAASLAGIAQPHLRYLLRESHKVSVIIGGFFFILLLIPLGWGIYQNPGQIWDLLAVSASLPDGLQFGKNLWSAASTFINPYNVSVGEVITPIIGLASSALLLIGAARMLRDFHSVRAHVLLIWAAILVPVIGLNPHLVAVLFVPTMLAIAIGLNQIIRYWYKLFPLNPYARAFGLLPLAVLLFSIVQFNYQRYMFGMLYSPQATATFTRDPFLAQNYITSHNGSQPFTLIVPSDKQDIYRVIAGRQSDVSVIDTASVSTAQSGTWLIADDAIKAVPAKNRGKFTAFLLTDANQNGRRFWVYQR